MKTAFQSLLGGIAAAANQIENKHDNRDNEQGVNQTAAHIQGKTQKPQHEQNSYDSPQHD
jgi:hypothetical protein